jgi:hypothetical protein
VVDLASLVVPKDPGVFASAALGGVHHEGAFLQGHPRETAGHHSDAVAIEDVGSEIDVAAFEVIALEDRMT